MSPVEKEQGKQMPQSRAQLVQSWRKGALGAGVGGVTHPGVWSPGWMWPLGPGPVWGEGAGANWGAVSPHCGRARPR